MNTRARQTVAKPLQVSMQPGFCRTVNIILEPPAIASNRTDGDDRAGLAGLPIGRKVVKDRDSATIGDVDAIAGEAGIGVDRVLLRHGAEQQNRIEASATL